MEERAVHSHCKRRGRDRPDGALMSKVNEA